VAKLRDEAERSHEQALAARLRADDAAHPQPASGGDNAGRTGRAIAPQRTPDEIGTGAGEAERDDVPTLRHDGRADWTQLLEAAIDDAPAEPEPDASDGDADQAGLEPPVHVDDRD
jgi:hypothetical protein